MRTRSVEPEVGFDLQASLGFLAGQLSKRMTARLSEQLAEHGLTTVQWAVLACLWREDGLAQKDISARTGIDAATLTEMLKRMAARELVRRERDPDNNRIQRVHLVSRDPALRDAIAVMAAGINDVALADFTPAERDTLLGLTRRAIANLDRPQSTTTEGDRS